jgi:small-conductance mechanosensitive channel
VIRRLQDQGASDLAQEAQDLVGQAADGIWAQVIGFLQLEVPILTDIAPDDTSVLVLNVAVFGIVIVGTFALSKVAQSLLAKAMKRRGMEDVGTVGTAQRLVHYVLVVIGFLLAIEQLGFDLTAIFAAGAVAAVGIGFALQNILQNFVSGFILLIERSVKPGDTIEIDGRIVKVEEMGIRATIVRNWDDEEVIIPNSFLVQNNVKNFTLRDDLHRLRCKVGVAYGSDMERTREVLLEAAAAIDFRNMTKDPACLLLEFGDSAVLFDVSVWTNDPWTSRINRSHLNYAVWHALKAADITIAFPQMDVHLNVASEPVGHPAEGAADPRQRPGDPGDSPGRNAEPTSA